MKLTLSLKQLEDAGACEEGIEAYGKVFGNLADVEWTLAVQIETLKGPLGPYVGWAYLRGLIPLWSMRSADLRYANLQSADLQSADLQYADLQSADLQSADLRYADLQSADLRYADLRYANLRYANLRYANLRSADLRYADLTGAKVCLCKSAPCASLREVLAAAGWAVGADGLLARAAAATATT